MVKGIILFLTIIVTGLVRSQNLVPIGDFENPTNCPNALYASSPPDIINICIPPWYAPTNGSADYFNSCGTKKTPSNTFGYQVPRSGQGYIGFYLKSDQLGNSYREYVQTPLTRALTPGKKYCVSFYVSLAEKSGLAIDKIGVFFSQGSFKIIGTDYTDPLFNSDTLPAVPQIKNMDGNFVADNQNWTKISGILTADKAYDHITIGNFSSLNYTPHVLSSGNSSISAYYYLDDVEIYEIPDPIIVDYQVCKGDSITLEMPEEYKGIASWLDEEKNSLGTIDSIRIKAEEPQKRYLIFQGICSIDTILYSIEIKPTPEKFLGNDTLFCESEGVVLSAPAGGISFLWSTEETSDEIFATQAGEYSVRIKFANGCWGADTIDITSSTCQNQLMIPNLFTPNGDSINDVFPMSEGFLEFEMIICNRWGEEIFKTKKAEVWDGKAGKHMASPGIYFWEISYKMNATERKTQKGWVQLVR